TGVQPAAEGGPGDPGTGPEVVPGPPAERPRHQQRQHPVRAHPVRRDQPVRGQRRAHPVGEGRQGRRRQGQLHGHLQGEAVPGAPRRGHLLRLRTGPEHLLAVRGHPGPPGRRGERPVHRAGAEARRRARRGPHPRLHGRAARERPRTQHRAQGTRGEELMALHDVLGSRRLQVHPGAVGSRIRDVGRPASGRTRRDVRPERQTPMTRVLVVEDDPQLVRALVLNLRARHYGVDAAPDGATALRLAAARQPDVVLLDLGLPDMDGVDIVKGLRGWSRVPILVLSARQASDEKVAALDAGADDYITKPFSMNELLARLRAAVRRSEDTSVGAAVTLVETDDFTIDLVGKKVVRDGRDVRLTPTEWHLLEILVTNPGRLITQKHLLQEVWGVSQSGKTNYLRVYTAQLRRKLERDPSQPRYLITEPGMGYRFEN